MAATSTIRAESLLTPTGLVGPTEVLVEAGIVKRISRAPKAADRLSGTLVPGLVDAHVHMVFDPFAADVTQTARNGSDEDLLSLVRRNNDSALAMGVTAVRDLGDQRNLVMRAAAEARRVGEPFVHLVTSGSPLTSVGGHCSFLGGEVQDAAEVAAAVRARAAGGSDWLKVMVSGGLLTPGSDPVAPQFSQSELLAITDLSKELGLRVAAHAHGRATINAAIQAGVDSIEHCTFQTGTHLQHDVSDSELALLAASEIIVCPTTAIHPGVTQDPSRLAWRIELIGRMHQAGVNLVNGTDAGVFRGLDAGSAAFGILAMVQAGVPVLEAISMSSWEAWEKLGFSGPPPVQPGSPANLMLVDSDPIADPNTLTQPLKVWINGKEVGGSK